MSTERYSDIFKQPLRKGPNGRYLCRWCGQECPKPRWTTCCEECRNEALVRAGAGHASALVFKRDKGVCAKCGVDTHALRKEWGALFGTMEYADWKEWPLSRGFNADGPAWEMDHIVEVVRGGGACGLDNLQTLCVPCHKAKTAALAARRAFERRAGEGQLALDDIEIDAGEYEVRRAPKRSAKPEKDWMQVARERQLQTKAVFE